MYFWRDEMKQKLSNTMIYLDEKHNNAQHKVGLKYFYDAKKLFLYIKKSAETIEDISLGRIANHNFSFNKHSMTEKCRQIIQGCTDNYANDYITPTLKIGNFENIILDLSYYLRATLLSKRKVLRVYPSGEVNIIEKKINHDDVILSPFTHEVSFKEVCLDLLPFSLLNSMLTISFKKFVKSSRQDHIESMCYLALMYLDGLGIKHSKKKAIKCFREVVKRNRRIEDYRLLIYCDDLGMTIAHCLARLKFIFDDYKTLKIINNSGWSVAHQMALIGYKFTDKEILQLSDKSGVTVAHIMANLSEYKKIYNYQSEIYWSRPYLNIYDHFDPCDGDIDFTDYSTETYYDEPDLGYMDDRDYSE